jgi:hypothetical protein
LPGFEWLGDDGQIWLSAVQKILHSGVFATLTHPLLNALLNHWLIAIFIEFLRDRVACVKCKPNFSLGG